MADKSEGRVQENLLRDALTNLLSDSQAATAEEIPRLIQQAARHLGAEQTTCYFADYEQLQLSSMPAQLQEFFPIEGTMAGRCFIAGTKVETRDGDVVSVWLPLINGTERLGVIRFDFSEEQTVDDQDLTALGAIAAELFTSKNRYSDAYELVRRRRNMSLAAEMQWGLLPPLTFVTQKVTVSGLLEPAYEVGGDAFDYALNEDTMHIAIVDAMGHGLEASLMSTLTTGTYRHCRRQGFDLIATYREIDQVVGKQFGEGTFVTAQLCELNCDSGMLRWINAGHPAPLLARGVQTIMNLHTEPALPFGFGQHDVVVHEEQLEPQDRVMFFTDGITEMKAPGGEEFGRDRLADLLLKESASGHLTAETMRRISHAIMTHHSGKLKDDATMVFLEWKGY